VSTELVLLDQLGAGAQAEVWLGIWWRSFGASTSVITVAVKRFHSHAVGKAFDGESVARCIAHPNVLKTFEVTTKAPYLLVSEYCEGGSLAECVYNSSVSLSWGQRLKVLVDVAKGMEYLHAQKPCILHRDLKTGNILLTKPIIDASMRPTAKVADFGLSRLIGGGQIGTQAMTRAVGTWRWMAPEVITSNRYDEKIDTFSFGMLMYEVLARQVPYADTVPPTNTDPRMGLTIVKGLRPTVSLVQQGCPARTAKLMEACWAQVSEDRPDFTQVRLQLQNQLDLVALYGQVKNDKDF
jgi:mitogen-activated protein kinase kinase kinase 9